MPKQIFVKTPINIKDSNRSGIYTYDSCEPDEKLDDFEISHEMDKNDIDQIKKNYQIMEMKLNARTEENLRLKASVAYYRRLYNSSVEEIKNIKDNHFLEIKKLNKKGIIYKFIHIMNNGL